MAESSSAALGEVKRQAAVDHILASARTYVLTNGLDATMDDLAEATGVSRRTLFRHFGSREKLLAAAFEAGIINYREQLPSYAGDLEVWLRATCVAAHRMNATIGPGFFDLASRSDLAPELASAEQRRRNEFRAAMADTAQTLWTAAGGVGSVPRSGGCWGFGAPQPAFHRGADDRRRRALECGRRLGLRRHHGHC